MQNDTISLRVVCHFLQDTCTELRLLSCPVLPCQAVQAKILHPCLEPWTGEVTGVKLVIPVATRELC